MQRSFSFEEEDDAPLRAQAAPRSPPPHYTTARGNGMYTVPAASSYMPQIPRAESPSPPPPAQTTGRNTGYPYGSPQYYAPPPQQYSQASPPSSPINLMDNSPRRNYGGPAPSAPQINMNPHNMSLPIPPPHRQISSSTGPYTRSSEAPNWTPWESNQTSSSPYHDSPLSDPFGSTNNVDERSMNQTPDYREHSTNSFSAAQNPFASRPNSYLSPSRPDTGVGSGSTSPAFGLPSDRTNMPPRPNSHPGPYPVDWRRESEADLGTFDPREIADDEDELQRHSKRGAAAAVAAVAGVFGSRNTSGNYGQVNGSNVEKSTWLSEQTKRKKHLKWLVMGLIGGVIVLAIIGGVVGVVVTSRKTSSSSNAAASANGPDLNAASPQIKALMNNPDLHKVFPGIDYTPLNAQYPGCLTTPPLQNNITMDVAVLSQLTPQIRLYGTDCNQTEMVLHAIQALNLQNDVKVWMGVWLDTNKTTSDRQMAQMYSVLDSAGPDPFSGIIVGNEVLFREDYTEQNLIDIIDGVRKNLTSLNMDLPVATSDLGTKWNTMLAQAVDVVMSNIHPFFGGVAAPEAAAWTWQYWDWNVAPTSKGLTGVTQTIAETGWPSSGGNYCTDSQGGNTTCSSPTAGAVASIDDMNTFLGEWVCQSLSNGTSYFWFEAFDEPWKVIYNTPSEQWETEWGLMDVNRNLKPGLKIPDCGGQEAKLPA